MALTLKQLKMTPKRTDLLEKMGLTDSDAILMCVPLRYQSREVIPYDQWQVKSEVILEGQIVRPARTMRIRGGKTMTKFQLENDDDCFEITIFNRPWASNLTVGQRVTVIGYYQGGNKITATTYNSQPLQEQLGVTPVYPLKEGMTDVYKRQVLGLPAIIIPSPYVPNNHQVLNAKALQSAGAALMIEEKDLTEGEITAKIESVVFDPIRLESMRTAAKRLGHPDASEQIYNWIQQG